MPQIPPSIVHAGCAVSYLDHAAIKNWTSKACMVGWGRRIIVIAPDGTALPCHSAASIPGLEFWNVRAHALADI